MLANLSCACLPQLLCHPAETLNHQQNSTNSKLIICRKYSAYRLSLAVSDTFSPSCRNNYPANPQNRLQSQNKSSTERNKLTDLLLDFFAKTHILT
jgi:hypothetical protein